MFSGPAVMSLKRCKGRAIEYFRLLHVYVSRHIFNPFHVNLYLNDLFC
jgi:hypothetical protein